MKNILFAIPFLLLLSCHSSKAMESDAIENFERQAPLDDTVLQMLQKNNELVLAFAVETYAWAKTKNYEILTLNNNEWKGYRYSVSITGHTSSGLIPTPVSEDSCNALWEFIKERDATKIPGDNGNDFCNDEKKSDCNINDGVTWRLFFVTKSNVTDPSYYEPQFYENCCPGNKNRQLFLELANKIKSIVGNTDGIEQ
jgi:hypothetical protein